MCPWSLTAGVGEGHKEKKFSTRRVVNTYPVRQQCFQNPKLWTRIEPKISPYETVDHIYNIYNSAVDLTQKGKGRGICQKRLRQKKIHCQLEYWSHLAVQRKEVVTVKAREKFVWTHCKQYSELEPWRRCAVISNYETKVTCQLPVCASGSVPPTSMDKSPHSAWYLGIDKETTYRLWQSFCFKHTRNFSHFELWLSNKYVNVIYRQSKFQLPRGISQLI